jgi:hypothetical protein
MEQQVRPVDTGLVDPGPVDLVKHMEEGAAYYMLQTHIVEVQPMAVEVLFASFGPVVLEVSPVPVLVHHKQYYK